jgi:hypothetical protein
VGPTDHEHQLEPEGGGGGAEDGSRCDEGEGARDAEGDREGLL